MSARRGPAAPDAMPSTRGLNFFLEDPTLAFVCSYHVLAGALLLAEGQALRDRDGGGRKFLAASLYARRWLRDRPRTAAAFSPADLDRLDALLDWTDVGLDALVPSR